MMHLEEMIKNIKIESKVSNLGIVENAVDSITREAGISADCYGKILVSVMEAVNNAIIHGNKQDTNKFVDVSIKVDGDLLEVTVTDEGSGFKPGSVPDPTRPENIENVNGRGIFLMKKLTDEIEFNKKGNRVRMKFKNILT